MSIEAPKVFGKMTMRIKESVSSPRKAIFAWSLSMLFVGDVIFIAYVCHVFGMYYGAVVLLICAIPELLGVRAAFQWDKQTQRDIILISIVTIGTIFACIASVWRWYESGLDRAHLAYLESLEVAQQLKVDPAFGGVTVFASPRGIYSLKGVVETEADLARLEEVTSRCKHVVWNCGVLVHVQQESEQATQKAGSRNVNK